MLVRAIFPLGKAYGKAFCNRTEETNKLINNAQSGKHSFLVAPRRYGKSSLCEQAFNQTDLAHTQVDFHLALTEKDAERIILNGVTELIGKAVGSAEKLVNVIKRYTKGLQPKFAVDTKLFKLEFALSADSHPADNIAEALLLLEKLLREKNKRAVFLFDEFQEIGIMKTGKAIEGAIRHVAQETRHLAFIFSGSNPHLLRAMFEDERRPLYKLCRKLILDRISVDHYKSHLNMAAKLIWKKEFTIAAFEKIIDLTERHPYYVNYLCDELCAEYKAAPTLAQIEKSWAKVVEEERSDLLKDFMALSENQRKLMVFIVNHGGENIHAKHASQMMDMPASSIRRALLTLIEKDYIERIGDSYRIVVPVYRTLLIM